MPLPSKPILEIDDVVQWWNSLPSRGRGRKTWDRWSVRAVLDAAEIEYLPRKKGAKLRFTAGAFERALGGDLLATVLDLEAKSDEAQRAADVHLDEVFSG